MKSKKISLLIFMLASVLIWGANRMHAPLLDQRKTLIRSADVERLPPLIALITVAAGGLRGIVADILWVRVTKLQNEGKYLELVQLSDWITKLEPHIDSVWIHHAWNLSYNVSVMYPDPNDRWRWVLHGMDLLRKDGMKYNPGSARLYQEMAWIFNHKLGAGLDRAHWFYKKSWSEEMSLLMDGPRPDYEKWKQLPKGKEQLLADPSIRDLVDRLKKLAVEPFNAAILKRTELSEPVQQLIGTHPGRPDFIEFVRRQTLLNHYKMDPVAMQEIEETFGPLDWHRPHTHAVYWAYQGKKFAKGFDLVSLNRLIYQSLMNAFVNGRVALEPNTRQLVTTTDPDLLEPTFLAFNMALEELPDNDSFKRAHGEFLIRAAIEMLTFGKDDQTKRLLDHYRKTYPSHQNAAWDDEKMIFHFLAHAKKVISLEQVEVVIAEMIQLENTWKTIGDPTRAAGYRRINQIVRNQAKLQNLDPGSDEEIIQRAAERRANRRRKAN